jgi:transcriptional regulatory protein RtcR
MTAKRRVVIGLIGSTLEDVPYDKRWEKWRPTVSLFQQANHGIGRIELLCQPQFDSLGKALGEDIKSLSAGTEVRLVPIKFEDPREFAGVYATLYDFVRGYKFVTDREEYLVHITTGTHVAQICLFLLVESRHIPGKLVQTSRDYKDKGSKGSVDVIDLELSKYEQIVARFRQESEEGTSFLKNGIATRNKHFNRLIDSIEETIITTLDPILLTGPTGVGKSQLAELIYKLKKKRHQIDGKFVEVNCATIRGDGAMSALFGHAKGAFTDARAARQGYLKSADKGILFLDEIGELGREEQAMLLRAIEKKSFFPLGKDEEEKSDFQLIAGTNSDLIMKVEKGEFRGDLLARIDHWTFNLPRLKDRPEDIEPNIEYELENFRERSGKYVVFNADARKRFLDFALSPEALWTRNFRDLNRAVNRMATLAKAGRITVTLVEEEISRLRETWRVRVKNEARNFLEKLLGKDKLAQYDVFAVMQLETVITFCRSYRSLPDANRALFPVSRLRKGKTNDSDRLRKYLRKFGITWRQIQDNLNGQALDNN